MLGGNGVHDAVKLHKRERPTCIYNIHKWLEGHVIMIGHSFSEESFLIWGLQAGRLLLNESDFRAFPNNFSPYKTKGVNLQI